MIFDKMYKHEIEVLELINKSIKTKSRLILTYLNQHCFNIYNSRNGYKNLLENEIKVYQDGIGIYLALKCFGFKSIERLNATDLNEQLFSLFSERGMSLFLVGGMFDKRIVTEKASQKNINILGYQDGFFGEDKNQSLINNINKVSPDAVIIGMGVPKQEFTAVVISQNIQCKLVVCVGNFLEYYFESQKRAPKIFRIVGLEWLFRLISEPVRLWRRYLLGIPFFIYTIIKLRFKAYK